MPPTSAPHPLDIAILGTRGVPANYGGFETFAEELSTRLVKRGHRVTVYGRSHFVPRSPGEYRGVRLRVLPCIRQKYLDTVTHTALSTLVALFSSHQVLLVCNAANAFLCALPSLAGQKVVLNVDGIERQRKKWNSLGRWVYRLGEFLSTVLPDQVIADALVIQEYYEQEYGFRARFIPYGALVGRTEATGTLDRLGLTPGDYVMYVSRLEPENNAHIVMEAHTRSGAPQPLVVVGDAPYSRDYIARLKRQAEGKNIVMPGAIYGEGYRELLSHCRCYVHATEVGGTHPALIEAMGAGCLVIVNDTRENREVLGEAGLIYRFNDPDSLAALIRRVCCSSEGFESYKTQAQERVSRCYDWESVVDKYEQVFRELVARG
ncbi:MAG: glycosyltransferase [Acidobacteria bacterium]|nr:MAG: glycosyltransferase [Acidobacteriota bacterium]